MGVECVKNNVVGRAPRTNMAITAPPGARAA